MQGNNRKLPRQYIIIGGILCQCVFMSYLMYIFGGIKLLVLYQLLAIKCGG